MIKMRTVENIKVIDACAAIKAMSVDGVLPDRIAEAIALEAKDYRKRFGKLPPGTMATCERVL